MNTLIYIFAKRGDQNMTFQGCFISQLWAELATLTVGMSFIFGTAILIFT